MKRPRDSQRARLYRAEQDAWAAGAQGLTFADLEGVRVFAALVQDRKWWIDLQAEHYVHVQQARSNSERGWARLPDDNKPARITLPPATWFQGYVLHELLHHATPHSCAWHGPHFAGLLIKAYEHELGVAAARTLADAMDCQSVRYTLPRGTLTGGITTRRGFILRSLPSPALSGAGGGDPSGACTESSSGGVRAGCASA